MKNFLKKDGAPDFSIEDLEKHHENVMNSIDFTVKLFADQVEHVASLAAQESPMSSKSERSMWTEWALSYLLGAYDGALQYFHIDQEDPMAVDGLRGLFKRCYDNNTLDHEALISKAVTASNENSLAMEMGGKDAMRAIGYNYDYSDFSDDERFAIIPNLLAVYLQEGPLMTIPHATARGMKLSCFQ